MPLALVLSNTSEDTISIASSAPWRIVEEDKETLVYEPGIEFWVVVDIPPGGSISWLWGQQDNGGNQVGPGTYYGEISWWYKWDEPGNSTTSYARIDIVGGAYWFATPEAVPEGSLLTMTLTNASEDSIIINDPYPWFITDLNEDIVYDPIVAPEPEPIPPGGTRGWTWDLMDDGGQPVQPGDYYAVIEYFDSSGTQKTRARDQFAVVPDPGVGGEVVWFVEPPINSTRSVVALTMVNATPETLWLSSTGPWEIRDEFGGTVHSPTVCCVIVPVPPGGTWTWPWDETYTYGGYVPEGMYTAVLGYSTTNPAHGSTRDTREFDFYLFDAEEAPPCVFVRSGKLEYWFHEEVDFTFTNCTPDTVGMHSQYTWWITNQAGFPVYWPVVLPAHATFAPLDSLSFFWDQKDILGNPVPTGTYHAVVEFTDKRYLTRYVVASNPVIVEGEAGVPDAEAVVSLAQSSPNPSRQSSTISYRIAERGHVTLQLYDVAGRLVRTLVDEVQEPRERGHTVEWNGADEQDRRLPSGVYFYRLQTDGAVQTRKLILLR
jgi:flagellar hook assembly protein FlgD